MPHSLLSAKILSAFCLGAPKIPHYSSVLPPAPHFTLAIWEEESQADLRSWTDRLSLSLSIYIASLTVVTDSYLLNKLFQKQDSAAFQNARAPIILIL